MSKPTFKYKAFFDKTCNPPEWTITHPTGRMAGNWQTQGAAQRFAADLNTKNERKAARA